MNHESPAPAGFGASIFDMDGLLIDSEVLWHEAEVDILGRLGVPISADGCRTTKGMFVEEVTRHWYGLHPWRNGPAPDEVAVTIVDRVIALVYSKGRLKPGALSAIDLCARRGLPLAVASSSQYRLIDAALDHFGLRDQFELVHSAEDEQLGSRIQPFSSPRRRRSVLHRVGVSSGRTLRWGAGREAASMACIAVPEKGEERSAFSLADLVVDSLLEVDDDALDEVESRRFGPLAGGDHGGPVSRRGLL